jgi:hypothetical protein
MTNFGSLFITTDLNPKDTLQYLLKITETDYTEIVHGSISEGIIYTAGVALTNFDIDVENIATQRSEAFSQEMFGFQATISMVFTPYNEQVRYDMQNWMIRTALELIDQTNWNIGIAFDTFSQLVLIRQGDKLVLNSLPDVYPPLWPPERLALVKTPYEMQEIRIG